MGGSFPPGDAEAADRGTPSRSATLEEVDILAELRTRPARSPDYAREHEAFSILVRELAHNPRNILQRLSEVAVEWCDAGSAGVSLLEGPVFRWHAAAGRCAPWRGGTMPQDGPCGVTIERGATQLMSYPIRCFPTIPPEPPIAELLLIPFCHHGTPVGTVWIVAHDAGRRFDAEDERLLGQLARFAEASWGVWTALEEAERTHRERRREKELLERILGSLPAATVTVFDRELRNRFVAGRGVTDMQWTPDAIVGKTVAQLVGPAVAELVAPMYERAFAGQSVTFDMGHAGHMLQVTAAPLDVTAAGVETIVVVAHNISHRVRLETALRQSEHYLKALVDNTMAHVCVLDVHNRITMINEHAASRLGVAREALIGRSIADLFPAEFADPILANNRRVLATGLAHQFEELLPATDGLHTYLSVRMPLFDDAGKAFGVFGISNDITGDSAAGGPASRTDQRKDEFIATLLHEMRQPLAAAVAALGVMKQRRSPDAGQRARAVVERQIERLRTLTDDLIESTRVAMGKIEMHPLHLDIRSVAEDAVAAVSPMMEARHQQFTLSLPEQPVWLDGDPDRLMQVVCNLLTNASKYTGEGGAIALQVAGRQGYVEVAVRDSGQGIPPDRLPYVFDLFVQASDMDRGGLGVGLAVVRGLVQRHGGTIEARSSGEGQGTEFIVRLPTGLRGASDRLGPAS